MSPELFILLYTLVARESKLRDEKEYSRWMDMALRTLNSSNGDLERGENNWACFKAQQSAEFAVKALLHGLGMPAIGHSVSKLLSEPSLKAITLPDYVMQSAKTLDKYYVPTRYPNAWVEGAPHEYYTEQDAKDAIRKAKEIVEWVRDVWRSLEKGREEKKQ